MNLSINSIKIFLGYGIAIFPLFLLIGPMVAEIFLLFLIFISLFFIIKEKDGNFLINKYLFFFSLFYLSTLISTLINFYNLDYSKSAIFYFRLPLFIISVWYILNNFNIFTKKLLFFYTLFFIILILDSLYQYYSGQNILGYEILKNRISSFFAEELILGGFITRIIPIFLIILIMNNKINGHNLNITFSILISLAILIVYLSGERSSFFLLFLFLIITFFICKYLRKFLLVTTLIFSILALIVSNFSFSKNVNPGNRMFVKSYNQIMGHGEERYEEHKQKFFNKIYFFSHDHHGHYLLSYKIFKDFPIFGTGAKGFRYLCRNKLYILEKDDGCSTHPHNTYIQIMVSNGIIGTSLILFALFYVTKEIFLSRKRIDSSLIFNKIEVSKAIILTSIFINLWPLIPSGNFFNNWLSMIYFYPVGFYLYFNHLNEKKTS